MKKILVCDDDIVLLKVIKFLFKDDNVEVVTVTNGADVLRAAKTHNPALILLDLMMPNKNGLAVMDDLKGDKDAAGIPVIIMSAVEKKNEISSAFRKGSADYIVKPFNSVTLHEKVLKYI